MALYITKVDPHPTTAGVLRVTFNEAVSAGSQNIASDADTLLLLRNNQLDSGKLTDFGPNGYHLTPSSAAYSFVAGAQSTAFKSTGSGAVGVGTSVLRDAVFNAMTVECFLKFEEPGTSDLYRVIFSIDGGTENDSFAFACYLNDFNRVHVQWQTAAGVYSSAYNAIHAPNRTIFQAYAFVKYRSGANAYVEVYRDNVLLGTGPTVANCWQSTNAHPRIFIRGTNQFFPTNITMDNLRVSSKARTSVERQAFIDSTNAAFTVPTFTINGGATVVSSAFVTGVPTQMDVTVTGLVKGATYLLTVANARDDATYTLITTPDDTGPVGYFRVNTIKSTPIPALSGFRLDEVRSYSGEKALANDNSRGQTPAGLGGKRGSGFNNGLF